MKLTKWTTLTIFYFYITDLTINNKIKIHKWTKKIKYKNNKIYNEIINKKQKQTKSN